MLWVRRWRRHFWQEKIFTARISTDRSDQSTGMTRHPPRLPSAGLTERCLLHSSLSGSTSHLIRQFWPLHSYNTMLPVQSQQHEDIAGDCRGCRELTLLWATVTFHLDLIQRCGHLAKDAFSIHWPGSRANIILCRKDVAESIVIDWESVVHLSESWFDRTARGSCACFTPHNFLKCRVQHILCSPQALFMESLSKKSVANMSVGLCYFKTSHLSIIFEQVIKNPQPIATADSC